MIQDDLLVDIWAHLSNTTLPSSIGTGFVAVGGSLSYGYADEHSDIDLVVAASQDVYEDLCSLGSVRNDFTVQGKTAHFIPVALAEYFEEPDKAPVERLFEQEHLVPLYDPAHLADQRKRDLGGLAEEWWISRRLGVWSRICDRWGRLDVTVERANLVSADVLWGEMLADLLRMACLVERKLYPEVHWLERAFTGLSVTRDQLAPLLQAACGTTWPARMSPINAVFAWFTDMLRKERLIPEHRI